MLHSACAGFATDGPLEADDGAGALCAVRSGTARSYLVVFADDLTDMTAEALLRALTAEGRALPIVLSGGGESEAVALLAAGAQEVLARAELTPGALRRALLQASARAQALRPQAADVNADRLRAIFKLAAVGIAEVGLDGQWLSVNDRLCSITGYTREELTRRTFGEITHPDDVAADWALARRLLAGEIEQYSLEKRYLRGDGSPVWVLLTGSLVRDPATRTPRHFIAVVQDISARKEAETALRDLNNTLEQRIAERTAELERSNRELDQFAYVASHDLRSPLRAIDQLAAWIAEDAGALLPAESLQHLEKLRGRVKRLDTLLEDLLAYSRAGRLHHAPQPVNVGEMVQGTVELLNPPAGFTLVYTTPLPTIRSERPPLEVVFRNLIGNAIKHHDQPASARVEVSAELQDGVYRFAVRDNGPGIAPEYHQRVFGLFQTLKPRDQTEGSGMGLAIVRKAVEARGGKVGVESDVGQGATFFFTWPQVEDE